MKKCVIALAALELVVFGAEETVCCSRSSPVSLREMCDRADIIARVTALEYLSPPYGSVRTSAIPDCLIRMRVEEVLKGSFCDSILVVNGYLGNQDDFNDHPVPYQFVRPGGRSGSCYANTYRHGAQFVLFLKHVKKRLTPYWYVLGPANEQVHEANDPWIWWLKGYLASRTKTEPRTGSK